MVGVLYNYDYAYFNVMMHNGKHGNLENGNKNEIKMKKSEPVAKISIYQPDYFDYISGFRFHSKSGEVLLEVGDCKVQPVEFALTEGERVIGVKSRIVSLLKLGFGFSKYHSDLQFIIGRLEA